MRACGWARHDAFEQDRRVRLGLEKGLAAGVTERNSPCTRHGTRVPSDWTCNLTTPSWLRPRPGSQALISWCAILLTWAPMSAIFAGGWTILVSAAAPGRYR